MQAEGAFDNINKKPDAKDKVLSEGAPHAPPPRRYRKPRLAASGEAFGGSVKFFRDFRPRGGSVNF